MTEEEVLPEEADPQEIVHWFDRPPVELDGREMAAVIAGAFTAGALAAVGLLALSGRLRT
jgi:hypothetical protein